MSADVRNIDGRPIHADQIAQVAEIRTAASVLLERIAFMRQAGISFNGMRDLYDILGYDRVISPAQYRNRFERGGIAGRIVEAFPNATWRGGVEVVEDDNPEKDTTFELEVKALDEQLKLWTTFRKLDMLAGQGRYACLLIGAGGDLSEELPKGNPGGLLYLTPFSEEDAQIREWDTNSKSERFGLPTRYQLSRLGAANYNRTSTMGGVGVAFTSADLAMPVHWSRIIHVAENALDSDVFGPPTLERVWNLLDDLDKVTGGGAEAFWLRANQGMQLDIDKDARLDQPELDRLKEQADEYQHQIRRMLRTKGVKATPLGSDVANFSNPADAILTQIAGARSIPKRILTGSEMGELASSQDRDNWKDQVNGRQSGYAGPVIVHPTLDRCIKYGYLSKPAKQYKVVWPHIEVMTESDKADGAKKWAETATADGQPVFTGDEIRDKWYAMKPLDKPVIEPEQLQIEKGVDPETGRPLSETMVDKQHEQSKENMDVQHEQAKEKMDIAAKQAAKAVKPKLIKAAENYEPLLRSLELAIRSGDNTTVDSILGLARMRTALSPDWEAADIGLVRTYEFNNRREMSAFLADLHTFANEVNHHPDTLIEDHKIRVAYCTHSAGNTITELDFQGAAKSDEIYDRWHSDPALVSPQDAQNPVVDVHSYSSTQIDLPTMMAIALSEFGLSIPEADLGEDGREGRPHVTVKYGLHTSDPTDLKNLLAGEPAIRIRLGRTAIFETEGGDVLHIQVESDDLHRLNALISSNLEATDTHPTYRPHATIAYLKAGAGQVYAGDDIFEGMEAVIDVIYFSPRDGSAWTAIPLGRDRSPLTVKHIEFDEFRPRTAGGPGSGNFGHSGRPGHEGGSGRKVADTVEVLGKTEKDVRARAASYGLTVKNIKRDEHGVWTVEVEGDDHAQLDMYVSASEFDEFRTFGGQGSGNFGHEGRPGAIGGSAPTAEEFRAPARSAQFASRRANLSNKRTDHMIAARAHQAARDYYRTHGDQMQASEHQYAMIQHQSAAFSAARESHMPRAAESLIKTLGQKELRAKYGITEFGPGSIGFAPADEKWYGWSHRAIWGFGVGDIVKKGDVLAEDSEFRDPNAQAFPIGFKAKSLDDARDMATAFALSVSEAHPAALGGAGSGNFGHVGRPGEVGGSGRGGARSDEDQMHRNILALGRRIDHEEKMLNSKRNGMRDAWAAWSEDIKNRKKPLKADGAAAKKLDTYKEAKRLEDEFHAAFKESSDLQREHQKKALDILRVSPELRSNVLFHQIKDADKQLHPGVLGRASQALEFFKRYDGSGVFDVHKFDGESRDQVEKILGGVKMVENADGTFSLPGGSTIPVAKGSGRANVQGMVIHLGDSRQLERAVYHEVAHLIEMHKPEIKADAVALRESLANQPRELFRLYETPHDQGGAEMALRGRFPDPYSAKVYENDVATEMISTGVESYLTDPVRFARERPEHFKLIRKVMAGGYRKSA